MGRSNPGVWNGFAETGRLSKTLRHMLGGLGLRKIRKKFAGPVQTRKMVQKIADINFISREVTADGVSVNRESHVRISSIAAENCPLPGYQLHSS